MANGPRLKRGPAKAPAHKKSAVLKHGATALHTIGGTPERRKILFFVLGFLALSGGGWCVVNKVRAGCAADETAETQAADEKEKLETQVDSFTFKVRVQMKGGKPTVQYSKSDLHIDQCPTHEGHKLAVKVVTLEDAGDGFVKFRVSIEGEAHGKPVKFEVIEDVFADGAERDYELVARRVESAQ